MKSLAILLLLGANGHRLSHKGRSHLHDDDPNDDLLKTVEAFKQGQGDAQALVEKISSTSDQPSRPEV
jgi:hypothetical protein